MKNLAYAAVELLVSKDFDEFDFDDKPMKNRCSYFRTKHIQLATQLTVKHFESSAALDATEIKDFIHGLNHLFFNGVAAGQYFEWNKEKEEN